MKNSLTQVKSLLVCETVFMAVLERRYKTVVCVCLVCCLLKRNSMRQAKHTVAQKKTMIRGAGVGREGGLFVGWLLNVPTTGECISGTDLHRQFYVLPHSDRSCRSNFLPHPVTVY